MTYIIGCGYHTWETAFWNHVDPGYIGIGDNGRYTGDWNMEISMFDRIAADIPSASIHSVYIDRCVMNTLLPKTFDALLLFVTYILRPGGRLYLTKSAYATLCMSYTRYVMDIQANDIYRRPIPLESGYNYDDYQKLQLLLTNGHFTLGVDNWTSPADWPDREDRDEWVILYRNRIVNAPIEKNDTPLFFF